MPNQLNIESNDVENGYIYKVLNNRLSLLEGLVKELNNKLSSISINEDLSMDDILEKINEIEKMAKLTYVKNHIEDSKRHLSDGKTVEWDNKYEKPTKGIPLEDLSADIKRKIEIKEPSKDGVLKFTKILVPEIKDEELVLEYTIEHSLDTPFPLINIRDLKTHKLKDYEILEIDENLVKLKFSEIEPEEELLIILIG
ncbi:hypothetical protein Bp8pS_024 [Bacillus phage vB_BpuM-BpSp]|nr:hypothetical protein Bp8pS_024 [Bacillus phage vB_BpuM-BpSp]